MILSPAEKDYLYQSLSQPQIVRPDARAVHQYRPLEATTSFLPGSNGSARIRLSDGSECIVSVKSKVVTSAKSASTSTTARPQLIDVDIDIVGIRDDSNYVANLRYQLLNLLQQNFPHEALRLTSRYAFKLFIDCIIISHSPYPLGLISFATYLALKTTKLPALISDVNDEEVAELPTFSDDWDNAQSVEELMREKQLGSSFQPPILITIGIIGDNLIFDPSIEEEQVLENGIIVSFYNGKVITPVMNTSFSSGGFKGFNKSLILKSVSLCNKYCPSITKALDTLVNQDGEGAEGSIF
ncbi:uncharacterized protein LODBEIA_P51750 [Lodderomyces beijingensis]|uniref:Ribosomal RNA-processing protein 42 n=1 Tax=Lodderomyces beijingensis TaxID=1775926 RepID=A0ABP0ZV81_9ASCO